MAEIQEKMSHIKSDNLTPTERVVVGAALVKKEPVVEIQCPPSLQEKRRCQPDPVCLEKNRREGRDRSHITRQCSDRRIIRKHVTSLPQNWLEKMVIWNPRSTSAPERSKEEPFSSDNVLARVAAAMEARGENFPFPRETDKYKANISGTPSPRLHVRNLSHALLGDDLRLIFEAYGRVVDFVVHERDGDIPR